MNKAVLTLLVGGSMLLGVSRESRAQSLLDILSPYGVTAADEVFPADPLFASTFGGPSKVIKIASDSGRPDLSFFGAYDPLNPANMTLLWTNDVPNGTAASVGGAFGLYLDNEDPAHLPGGGKVNTGEGGTFFTEQALNYDGAVHIREFRVGSNLFLGFEDLSFPLTDGDYNDLVVRVNAVPEADSRLLVAFGAAGMFMFRWRLGRRRAPANKVAV